MKIVLVIYSLILLNSLASASAIASEYITITKDQVIRTNNIVNIILQLEKVTDITNKTTLKIKELNFLQKEKSAIIDTDKEVDLGDEN